MQRDLQSHNELRWLCQHQSDRIMAAQWACAFCCSWRWKTPLFYAATEAPGLSPPRRSEFDEMSDLFEGEYVCVARSILRLA